MKRMFAALLAALMAVGAANALAQTVVDVYIDADSMEEETALRVVQLLEQAFEGVRFGIAGQRGETLRSLILADCAPDLAICTPQEAAIWAREGLLVPLDGCIEDEVHIAQAVLAPCRTQEGLFMAPLYARHRQMAVNRRLMEEAGLGHLLNARDYPVWLPMQMLQVLDELTLSGHTAMELWPVQPQDCGPALALMQSLYGGALLHEDGRTLQKDWGAAQAGAAWLADMAQAGLIGRANSREEALYRFLAGETAVFADWSHEEDMRYAGGLPIDAAFVPYPCAAGLPVHVFDVVGVCAFAGEGAQALGRQVIRFLAQDQRARLILGEGGMREDGMQWLAPLGANEKTARLRSVLCVALQALFAGEMDAEHALMYARKAAGVNAE